MSVKSEFKTASPLPKKILMRSCLAMVFLLIQACDAPRSSRRVKAGSSDSPLFGIPVSGTTTSGTDNSGSTSGGDDTGSGDTVGGNLVPAEVDHCRWSSDGVNGFEYSATHMDPNEQSAANGRYTICKSKTNPMDIYLQVQNPIDSEQLCIIPTTHSGSNSVYIGEPRCLYLRSNTTLYKVSLLKNRPGYTNYQVTGVMMMKDKLYEYGAPFYQMILSPDAYIFCSQWLAQYGDPSYCIPFKAAGHYVYHQFQD
jgi:hypothetical protein